MSPTQIAGTLLTAGTLTFWLGVALPTWRVYTTADLDERVRLINDMRGYWVLAHIFLLVGVVVVAVGLGVFTGTVEAANMRLLATVGLAAIILASLVWAYIVLAFRLGMSAEEYVRTTAGAWTFPAFVLLTLGSFILFGIVLLSSGFPAWSGLATIGLSSLILIAFLIQKDSVPGLFYVITLLIGITLLFG